MVEVGKIASLGAHSLVVFFVTANKSTGDLGISLFNKRLSDTLSFRKSNQWSLAFSDGKHVGKTGGEGMSLGVLDVNDLVGTWMVLDVHELSNTTNIVSSCDEDVSSILEFDNFVDFASLKVNLDCVVLLDFWVGEANRPAIVGYNVWNLVFAHALSLNSAELESSLLGVDTDSLETSFDVVQNAEVLAGFGDLDNIHKAKWEAWVSSNFVVNFDISVSVAADFDRVLAGERVFESVLQKHGQGNALPELVGAC